MELSILVAIASVGGLGLLFGGGLAYASKKFYVKVDPRIEQLEDVLPGSNCGACGLAGCKGLAIAVLDGKVETTACPVGGQGTADAISEILDVEVGTVEDKVAVVRCLGSPDKCGDRFDYQGFISCSAATLVGNGHKKCDWGCLGFWDCVRVCTFNAMAMGDNGLPIVLDDNCTACGKCVDVCPRDIMDLIPRSANIFIACMNPHRGKQVKQVCKIGCTGCTLCANPKNTPSGMISMVEETNLPIFDYSIEDDPVVAVHKCPTDSLVDKKAGKRPVFYISDSRCTGVGECKKVCPVKGCIEQLDDGKHIIHADKCIGCGLCEPACPENAIGLMSALGHQSTAA